jgi:hypothetical protein
MAPSMRCNNFLLTTTKKNAMDSPTIKLPVSAVRVSGVDSKEESTDERI